MTINDKHNHDFIKNNDKKQQKVQKSFSTRESKGIMNSLEFVFLNCLLGRVVVSMNRNEMDFSDKLFEAFSKTSPNNYIFLCNMWTDISRWSKSAVEDFGLPGEYMEGAGRIWEGCIHPEDRQFYHEDIEQVFRGEKRNHDIMYRVKDKSGTYVLCACNGVVIEDEEGRPSYFAGSIKNHGPVSEIPLDARVEENTVVKAAFLQNDNRTKESNMLMEELRKSIMNGCEGFFMSYQPLVDAKSGEMQGMEALVRYKKEAFGNVPPGRFIPLLEQEDLFFELGNWILRQVFHDGKEFLKDNSDLIIHVNISYRQIERKEFRSKLVSMMSLAGFPPENLCLELTERCNFLNMDCLRNEVEFFRSCGIKIALDDFGTGFSSFNLLREIPVDIIKIDREFVKDIESNRTDQSIVQAIVQCAHNMSIPVCVEGIENEELKQYMQQYDVTKFQGYYFAKPLDKEQFKASEIYVHCKRGLE